jgi:alpha-maltose-1-phosphate synthase
MEHAASHLHRKGMLRLYGAPAAFSSAEIERFSRLPAPVGPWLGSQAARRQPPEGVPVRRIATGFEAANVIAARVAPSSHAKRGLADLRDLRFDHGMASLIESTDSAAYLTFGSALKTIRRAHRVGVATLLQQALHHHRFNVAILQEEARLQPAYAGTLQFHTPNARRRRVADAELRETDWTMVLSSFSKQTYVSAGVEPDRVIVNPLGVAAERFADVRRRDDATFRVLFLGVLTQRKGLSYLLEGFRRAAIPGSELVLAGQRWGSDAPWTRLDCVREIPWVEAEALPRLFAEADVLVLPSLVEGFARVILEAMASGVPVVITPNTGGGDAVRDGVDGYQVPIRDPDSIAERLRHLHSNPDLLAEMRRKARERAAEFSWERYAEEVARAMRLATGETVA